MKTDRILNLLTVVVIAALMTSIIVNICVVVKRPKVIRTVIHHSVSVVDNARLDSLQLVVDQLSKKQARLEREQKEINQELTEIFD